MKTTPPALSRLIVIALMWLMHCMSLWAKDAALSAYSLSVNLSKGSATFQGFRLEAYFTTYDGSAGIPLYDSLGNLVIFSGELSPNPATAGSYRTDYVLFENGDVDSSGTATVNFPVTDADGNGVADFLQVNRSGSVTLTGTVTRQLPSASPTLTMTGQLTRAAGNAAGSYVATIQDPLFGPITYRGASFLLNAQGSLSYERGTSTATLSAVVSNEDGTTTTYTGATGFTVLDANTLGFPAITFSGTNARLVQGKAFTLVRSGKRYLGNLEFQDGGLSTSWRDYTQWRMEISDNNDSDGDGIPDLSDSVPVAPAITAHPQPVTVTAGQTAQFSVTATGTAPLAYQWQRNGTNLPGATAANFSVVNVQTTDAGSYRVIVSNAAGTATSTAATLTVMLPAVPPEITAQPLDQTVTAGAAVSFTVTATGTAPLSYLWQRKGVGDVSWSNLSNDGVYADVTTATLRVNATAPAMNGDRFRCAVANSASFLYSNPATLTVTVPAVPPEITAQPLDQTVTAGATVSFTVTATGTAPLSYLWQRKGVGDVSWSNLVNDDTYADVTTATLRVSAVTPAMNGDRFRCAVANGAGFLYSNAGTPTVVTTPLVLSTPRLTAGGLVLSWSGGFAPFTVWQRDALDGVPRELTTTGETTVTVPANQAAGFFHVTSAP